MTRSQQRRRPDPWTTGRQTVMTSSWQPPASPPPVPHPPPLPTTAPPPRWTQSCCHHPLHHPHLQTPRRLDHQSSHYQALHGCPVRCLGEHVKCWWCLQPSLVCRTDWLEQGQRVQAHCGAMGGPRVCRCGRGTAGERTGQPPARICSTSTSSSTSKAQQHKPKHFSMRCGHALPTCCSG